MRLHHAQQRMRTRCARTYHTFPFDLGHCPGPSCTILGQQLPQMVSLIFRAENQIAWRKAGLVQGIWLVSWSAAPHDGRELVRWMRVFSKNNSVLCAVHLLPAIAGTFHRCHCSMRDAVRSCCWQTLYSPQPRFGSKA